MDQIISYFSFDFHYWWSSSSLYIGHTTLQLWLLVFCFVLFLFSTSSIGLGFKFWSFSPNPPRKVVVSCNCMCVANRGMHEAHDSWQSENALYPCAWGTWDADAWLVPQVQIIPFSSFFECFLPPTCSWNLG